jgi:hypothetical protein
MLRDADGDGNEDVTSPPPAPQTTETRPALAPLPYDFRALLAHVQEEEAHAALDLEARTDEARAERDKLRAKLFYLGDVKRRELGDMCLIFGVLSTGFGAGAGLVARVAPPSGGGADTGRVVVLVALSAAAFVCGVATLMMLGLRCYVVRQLRSLT